MKALLSTLALATGCSTVHFIPEGSTPLDRPPTRAVASSSASPFASTMPDPGAPASPRIPIALEARLKNGIRVLMLEDRSFPLVSLGVVLKRGSIDAAPGVFDLFVDLMSTGSELIAPKALHETLFAFGATRDVQVRLESSTVSTKFVPMVLHDVVRIITPTFVTPRFDSDEYDKLVDDHRRRAVKNRDEPGAMARRELYKLLFPAGSPYAADVADDPKALDSVTRDALRGMQAFVGADDVAVVAAGQFTPRQLMPLLEESLGPLKPGARPRAPMPDVTIPTAAHVLAIDHPGDSQVQIALGFMTVPYDHPDFAALYFLGDTLQRGARDAMRLGHGLTYGVSGGVTMLRVRAPLTVTAAVSAEGVKQALRDTFDSLSKPDSLAHDPAEFARRKAWMLAAWPDTFDTVEQSMRELETLAKLDLPVDFWVKLRDAVRNLTAEDVVRVAKQYLDPTHAQLVVLGDLARFKADVDALGIAQVEVRRAH